MPDMPGRGYLQNSSTQFPSRKACLIPGCVRHDFREEEMSARDKQIR